MAEAYIVKSIFFFPDSIKLELLDELDSNLSSFSKVEIISSLNADENKLKSLDNYKSILSEEEKTMIIASLDDKYKYDKFNILPDDKYYSNLGLSEEMTIGVELEVEGKYHEILLRLGQIYKDWGVDYETALKSGVEIKSPILKDIKSDMYDLALVCNVLNKLGFETSTRTGGHIHIGANIFGLDYKAWENFYTIYNNAEEIIYKISNQKGEIPREGISRYAKSSGSKLKELFQSGDVLIDSGMQFKALKQSLSDTRNRGVNLTNISMAGINTIEFRMPNGSIDIDVIRDNIKLFGKLVDVSKEMSLDPETKKEEFENFKINKTKDEEVRVDSLLDLLFDDDNDRKKYKERWKSVKEYDCFKNEEIDNIKYNKKQNKIKENDMTSFKELDNSDELDR